VATLLIQEKIAFSKICENTISEFNSYIWDAKASKHGDDKPIKQHDHAMDAVRYFCYTIINPKNKIKVSSKAKLGLR